MTEERIKVLYIDDEQNNLGSFKAAFRRDFDIFTAQSAEEGLQILSQETIHVIIADQRMPNTTGVEFFESIISKHPHPIRILLTGYSDISAVIDAINRGQVYRFIEKPWNQDALSVAIQNAYEIYHTRSLLDERNLELQKAYEELERFVYSASHDLRAPITSILGILNMAKEDESKNNKEYLRMIESTIHKMDVFVQNIIKYYRTTQVELETNNIDFSSLVDNVWKELSTMPEVKGINFTKTIDQKNSIQSDESRVRIILTNILLNAVQFIDESKSENNIHVKVNTNPTKAFIQIEDNGIGIEPSHREDIFKMFFRSAHKNAGSGVGLYVVKEALKKIEGSIFVESTPGQGSSFKIEFPSKDNNKQK